MIQQNTLLKVADNSGAKIAKCIKVLGGFKKKTATLGDTIVVSISKLRAKNRFNSKVLKGTVSRALVISVTNKIAKKKDGIYLKQNKNLIVLVNKQGNPLGTRILSGLPKALKKKKYLKYLSICPGLF